MTSGLRRTGAFRRILDFERLEPHAADPPRKKKAAVIVLLIFGAGKLPQIGDALGKSIRNFKKSASGRDEKTVDVTPKPDSGLVMMMASSPSA